MRERPEWNVREALDVDGPRVRALLRQLGYDVTDAHVDSVLVRRGPSREVFVAVVSGAGVVGLVETLVPPPTLADSVGCEITALVVEDEFRSCGIGEGLVARAEAWARERGCGRLRVRTNVLRERAHAFYERLGYERLKAQHVYERAL
ncbi:MAG: GNAT family N-acetyltransferase [Vulcanimicrobiaceae bacterium]